MFPCVLFATRTSPQGRVLEGGLKGLETTENGLALDFRTSYIGDLLCVSLGNSIHLSELTRKNGSGLDL